MRPVVASEREPDVARALDVRNRMEQQYGRDLLRSDYSLHAKVNARDLLHSVFVTVQTPCHIDDRTRGNPKQVVFCIGTEGELALRVLRTFIQITPVSQRSDVEVLTVALCVPADVIADRLVTPQPGHWHLECPTERPLRPKDWRVPPLLCLRVCTSRPKVIVMLEPLPFPTAVDCVRPVFGLLGIFVETFARIATIAVCSWADFVMIWTRFLLTRHGACLSY